MKINFHFVSNKDEFKSLNCAKRKKRGNNPTILLVKSVCIFERNKSVVSSKISKYIASFWEITSKNFVAHIIG